MQRKIVSVMLGAALAISIFINFRLAATVDSLYADSYEILYEQLVLNSKLLEQLDAGEVGTARSLLQREIHTKGPLVAIFLLEHCSGEHGAEPDDICSEHLKPREGLRETANRPTPLDQRKEPTDMSHGTPSWSLENAQQISKQYPYTFYKPSSTVIGMLRPGNHVKLIFLFHSDDPEAPRAERMWVTIDAVEGSVYRGTLENRPLHINDLQVGQSITFNAQHIIDTDITDPVPSIVDKYATRCFVSRRILDEGAPVGYLYREEPERTEDSGWRIMTGDETPEYMDDAANIAWVSLGTVLREDDSITHLLEAPVGSAYERQPEMNQFVPVAEERGF